MKRIIEAISTCIGKNIIFAQVHEDALKVIVVLDVAKVVVIKVLVIKEEPLLSVVIRLVKQKYKNKDLIFEVDGIDLQTVCFVEEGCTK